jgi:hypothetical protein
MLWQQGYPDMTTPFFSWWWSRVDGFAKTIVSRKGAKNAKKKSFNIKKLTLRPLRLSVRFWLFMSSSRVFFCLIWR